MMLMTQRDIKTKQLDELIKLFYAAVPTGDYLTAANLF